MASSKSKKSGAKKDKPVQKQAPPVMTEQDLALANVILAGIGAVVSEVAGKEPADRTERAFYIALQFALARVARDMGRDPKVVSEELVRMIKFVGETEPAVDAAVG